MNKRQKKKREGKRILIVADEFNLLNMTEEESEKALKDFEIFKKKYSYRKRYKDLNKVLWYSFPPGKATKDWIRSMVSKCRKQA